ncbi:MAG: TRAP transporter substrate-binding protein [Desulfomonile tiedjei]|uniref:TRAP transporter substrate-binding protein n=1 Tax=Desulfomonile tiedjei TaxID=2358 RepID=A0A9D6Z058_9BACT|nr:TRAP transporter substrate-binding protein [Desulfomonile tiedjei]
MHGKVSNVLVCSLVTVLLVLASGPGTCANTVTLSYSTFFPATHAHTLLATEWAKEVEKRTNGAVKINMFPGGTLTPPDQCYDGVVKGISDIGMSVVSYTMGRFPLTEVIDLPLGYTSGVQASRLSNAYYEKFKPKEFDDVKMMYMHAYGPGIVHTAKKPVKTMEDLKGLKIRCSGTSAKVVGALGATPVAMPQPEVYDALQKGIVEGVVCPIEALIGFKLTEVTQYTTLNYGSSYSLAFFVAMNKKKWDSLPKDVQETIQKINMEWIDRTGQTWDRIDKEAREFALSKGHEFIPLSKEEDARWAQTVNPIMAEYVAAMKAKNLPGEEALNFCVGWMKKNP